jgi:hypothetical protein
MCHLYHNCHFNNFSESKYIIKKIKTLFLFIKKILKIPNVAKL